MTEHEIDMYVESVSSNVPIKDTRLKSIYDATQNDEDMQKAISLTKNGLPESEKDLKNTTRTISVHIINFQFSMEC